MISAGPVPIRLTCSLCGVTSLAVFIGETGRIVCDDCCDPEDTGDVSVEGVLTVGADEVGGDTSKYLGGIRSMTRHTVADILAAQETVSRYLRAHRFDCALCKADNSTHHTAECPLSVLVDAAKRAPANEPEAS